MSNKISKSFRLSPDACAILSDLAKQSGTNETVTIERLIIDAGKSKDAHTVITESILSALDQKYENTITGLRLATRSTEKNIYLFESLSELSIANYVITVKRT